MEKIIKGLRCETCGKRYSEKPVYAWHGELYVYIDLGGATRCFCPQHMTFCNKNGAMMNYNDKDVKVRFGAKTITEILKEG